MRTKWFPYSYKNRDDRKLNKFMFLDATQYAHHVFKTFKGMGLHPSVHSDMLNFEVL